MTKNNDTALLPVNVQAVQDRVKQLMKDIGFPDSTTVYTAFMQLANEFSQGCFTDRPTAPQNAALGVDRQSVDQETVTNEMIAAALEESLAVMKEYGVDGLSPFSDYPPPSVVVKRAITAALKVRPTAPQNAEALEALEYMTRYPALAEKFKDLKKFDHAVETIRNALQSPARPVVKPLVWVDYEDDGMKRCVLSIAKCIFGQYQIRRDSQGRFWPEGTKMLNETFRNTIDEAKAAAEAHWQAKIGECLGVVHQKSENMWDKLDTPSSVVNKIDGLREAVDTVVSGYDRDGIADWYVEAMDKVLDAARAQLAAQEGGVG